MLLGDTMLVSDDTFETEQDALDAGDDALKMLLANYYAERYKDV